MGERPDAALYTLFLRALLQQNKWQEGMLLFRRMLVGKEVMGRPNHHTLNCLLQYQVSDVSYLISFFFSFFLSNFSKDLQLISMSDHHYL